MAVARDIAAFDFVELVEAADAAPAGARGGVLEIAPDGTAMVEVIEPELEGLDRIVFCSVSGLRPASRAIRR